MTKKVKKYKSQSVIPHRRAKAESSSRSHLPFPLFIQHTPLSIAEARRIMREYDKKQNNLCNWGGWINWFRVMQANNFTSA